MTNIVITGANRGIGLELAKIYAKEHQVYAICRKVSDELNALNNVTIISEIDLRDTSSIQAAVDQCPDQIDILINNAGIMARIDFDMIGDALDDIQDQFHVNAIAPLLLTFTCKDKLVSGSKVALITSRMGSIGDNGSGASYGYRMSKTALNAAGKSLSIDLKPQGIAVAILHPGWVQTDMTGKTGLLTPTESASALVNRIEDLNINNTGTFWHSSGEILEW